MSATPFANAHTHHGRWRAGLLAVWASVSFGACFFARDLQFLVAGWPLHYWLAAQGALLAFVAVVVVYAVVANRTDATDAALKALRDSTQERGDV